MTPLLAILLALAACPEAACPAALGADAVPSAAEEPAEVVFYAPASNRPAFGDTEVEVDVYASGVEEVIFVVDGAEVARLTGAPYRITTPLGEGLGAHHFEVIVVGKAGEIVRGSLETPALRVDEELELELQQLYVTVDGSEEGGPVALEAKDFLVRDNGRRQSIVTFETGDAALAVSVLIDASESMQGGRLESALVGARSFLEGMRELDEAAIYLFSDSIRFISEFSQSSRRLAAGLLQVEPAGGTAINDTLYTALRRLEARQGRRVVILLSDGVDTHSALASHDVLWTMRRSRSLVYWIELVRSPAVTSPWRDTAGHIAEHVALRTLVEESGGRALPIEDTEEAIVAFESILAELRRQYVLGYYPRVDLDDGSWHDVEIKLSPKRLRARVRGGYVD